LADDRFLEGALSYQPQFTGPLYYQVYELLRARIASGEWRSGAPVPGEAELARELSVSVGTVRKTMDELTRERLVVRERGRGTLVKNERPRAIRNGFQISEADGLAIGVVKIGAARASAEEASTLQIHRHLSPPRVVKIHREWRHSGKLICVETITLDERRFPNLQAENDLSAPELAEFYGRRFRISLDRVQWSFRGISSDDAALAHFGGMNGVPFIACTRISYDEKDVAVEIAEQLLKLSDTTPYTIAI